MYHMDDTYDFKPNSKELKLSEKGGDDGLVEMLVGTRYSVTVGMRTAKNLYVDVRGARRPVNSNGTLGRYKRHPMPRPVRMLL